MAATPLFDISGIDLDHVLYGPDVIRAHNPHRGCMELLQGIVHYDPDALEALGFHQVPADPFWAAGHIPGFPIMPGALMVEAAAQLSSFCYRKRFGASEDRFFGFGGIDKIKFRGMVRPGDRLYVLCTDIVLNRRFSRFNVQGICHDKIAFDGEIIGVAMPVQVRLEREPERQEGASTS